MSNAGNRVRDPRREDSESIGYAGSTLRSKTKERCYYSIFCCAYIVIVLLNIISFSLFLMIIDIHPRANTGSLYSSCILWNNSADWNAVWTCDVVLACQLAVLVGTVLISFVYYPILLCLGAKM